MRSRPRRRGLLWLTAGSVLFIGALVMPAWLASASGASSRASTTAENLSGVTITFGDQVKEFQTLVNATNTLKGAPYTVNWANFVGGPPIIAAEVGGSVDLGDMAETPTIFAQSAGDPVKVVAVTQGIAKKTPYGIMVPAGSSITKASQLRGKTIAVQEGTVEQYVLVKVLQAAGIPYSAVTVENLNIIAGEAALTSGKVDAWVGSQPYIALVQQSKQGKVISSAASSAKVLGYLTAPTSSLKNPKKAAAIADFVVRLYKANAILRKDPTLAAKTYVSTYGVSLAVAKEAVKTAESIPSAITSSLVSYQQQEANTFYKLGLIPKKINVSKIFDRSLNKTILADLAKS